MDGVTIIATTTGPEVSLWAAIFTTVIFVVLWLLYNMASVGAMIAYKFKPVSDCVMCIIFMVVSTGIVFGLVHSVWEDHNTIETKQVVTIDDSVSYNEFNQKYEVISQNGDLYTVKVIDQGET